MAGPVGRATVALRDCSGKGPSGRKPRAYEAHSNKLTQLASQPDGKLLASVDMDPTLALWDRLKHDKVIGGGLLSAPASCLRWRQVGAFAVGP
ncbi:WD40 domain-containing protein [Verrucomicrobia bacterium]|nr:WD40 domain-containing protein [Verrucomicrobiota bacterium]